MLLPDHTPPADAYEIPTRIRDAVRARQPASAYPWSAAVTRLMDLDHTVPWRPPARGGPPGQTRVANLAPLTRTEHRLKTAGHLATRQPAPGVHLWATRHGWITLVTPTGTYPLGRGPTARALWHAAAPPGNRAPDSGAERAAVETTAAAVGPP